MSQTLQGNDIHKGTYMAFSLMDEVYGKKAMIYVYWASPEDKKKGEAELKQRGYRIHRYDPPTASEIQVTYFKGWHWDE